MTSILYLLLSILIMAVLAALFVLRKDFVKGFKQGWNKENRGEYLVVKDSGVGHNKFWVKTS